MYVIYADELFLENLLIDYILLILTAKLSGTPVRRLRVLAAALIGAAYSALTLISGLGFVTSAVFKLAVGVIMVMVVFGGSRRFIRICLIFFALSAAFAGAVMAALLMSGGGIYDLSFGHVTFGVLCLSFSICYCVFTLVFRRIVKHSATGEITQVVIENGGRRVKVAALVDTGNALVDPISGGAVTVCSLESICELFDEPTLRILRSAKGPTEIMEQLGSRSGGIRFCLVPYSAVGTKSGMLLAFRPESVIRGGKRQKGGMIAIAPEGIAEGNGYSALTNAC
ncbi:MAG: sigma-E processing peptidase SpoIIGA [Oscillospiraceae bacterium]